MSVLLNDTCDSFANFTTTGSPTVVAALHGNGFNFPGSTSHTASYNIAGGSQTDQVTVGFNVNFGSFSSASSFISFRSDAGATEHVRLLIDAPNGVIYAFNGSGSFLGNTSGTMTTATWYLLEFSFKLHDTTGSLEIRRNGVQVLNLTNVDTKNGGTSALVDQVRFAGISSASAFLVDDVYIRNDSTFGVPFVLTEPFNDFTTNGWVLTGNSGAGAYPTIVTGRTGNGAQCRTVPTDNGVATYSIPAVNQAIDIVLGFAWKISSLAQSARIVEIWSDTNSTNHNNVGVNTDGSLNFMMDGVTMQTTAAGVVAINTWYYIEIKAHLADLPNGSWDVRVNGVSVLSGTGDTKNGGTKTVYDAIRLGPQTTFGVAVNAVYDDLYMRSDTTFQGDPAAPATVAAVLAGSWGPLTAAMTATVEEAPGFAALWGPMTGGMVATVGHAAVLAGSWGPLTAAMTATVACAPPANNDWADAAPITLGVLETASNCGATLEASEPSPSEGFGHGSHSVWWTFDGVDGGEYTLSTEGSTFDTILAVYTGASLATLTEVVSNDDNPDSGSWSVVEFTGESVTYYVQVTSYRTDEFGIGDIALLLEGTEPPPPAVEAVLDADWGPLDGELVAVVSAFTPAVFAATWGPLDGAASAVVYPGGVIPGPAFPCGGFTCFGATGVLTINGQVLNCPAWDIPNLARLWAEAAVRGENQALPTVPGVRGYPTRVDQTDFELRLFIRGDVDQTGASAPTPWEGLEANVDLLWANVFAPVTSGRGTKTALLTMPDGSTRIADVQVRPPQLAADVDDPTMVETTFTLTVVSGRFAVLV